MLIEKYAENWLDELRVRAAEVQSSHRLYLLIDGAFVPGLHRSLANGAKAILFASLPACSEEAKNVSPFLVPFDPTNPSITPLLARCDRWPMVSALETPETLAELSQRLAAWCVIEADKQRFNFRFPDTRRLPAIFQTLNTTQRAQMVGPAVRWAYVARDGHWRDLDVDGLGAQIADAPALDELQFATLVDDSRADEVLTLLSDRGYDVYSQPSKSHTLLVIALRVAAAAGLNDSDTVDWCEWFWKNGLTLNDGKAMSLLVGWRNTELLASS